MKVKVQMRAHDPEIIPMYVARQLSATEHDALEKHLRVCQECQSELAFWQELAEEITAANATVVAPADLADNALARIHTPGPIQQNTLRAYNLLRSQAYLVKREMWPASAAIMALSVVMALLARQAGIITFIAPLMAAASLTAIYGPNNDPASELTLATPTSPWKILLARLTLVSGYNLLLTLTASLALLPIIPLEMLDKLILTWLGPLCLLSALALLLSLWIGTSNAITLSYGLWVLQYIQPPEMLINWPPMKIWETLRTSSYQFWQSPILLLSIALFLVVLALWSTRSTERALAYGTL